ncbi:MAG: hypothetical protein HPY69_20575 [Armatimonadetes bacterium]|nr:hypothetical protein [Armatimonadota bacterium]
MLRRWVGPLFLASLFPGLVAITAPAGAADLPRLVDLGAGECIPCKQMAPILEELRAEFANRFLVEFVDVWENPAAADRYRIRVIPTQIFLGADGKELFRHEGFFSKEDILAKWRELGVEVGGAEIEPFSRWEPAQPDTRAKEAICYLCDGDNDPRSQVEVQTDKGSVDLCSPHHFFVLLSCLTTDVEGTEARARVTDWSTGQPVAMQSAVYLYGFDEETGRPTIKAFGSRDAALAERMVAGGSLLGYDTLKRKELSQRCGFCDRAVYPEDVAQVKVGGVYSWGCCSHCALGVAARTGMEVEVLERDRLTGDPIRVRILQGSIVSVEPSTAVAWYGQRTRPDGTRVSAGCFHQGFFTSPKNLRLWVEAHPLETGEMITIHKALTDKMALSPEQIRKACKIGECAPK